MRLWLTTENVLLFVAFTALFLLRSWPGITIFVALLAYVVVRRIREPLSSKGFLVDKDEHGPSTVELDVDLKLRRLPNHFRYKAQGETFRTASVYEYRLEGTEVSYRLITNQNSDIGDPEHFDVLDGVVPESEMRKRAGNKTEVGRSLLEDRIESLKKDVEWNKMTPSYWNGLKYFIVSKKQSKTDARRYLRQELERLKVGTEAFCKEAEKYGFEKDETSLERFKVAEGKPKPTTEEVRRLNESVGTFGITYEEFWSEKRLCGVLEKLLGDS